MRLVLALALPALLLSISGCDLFGSEDLLGGPSLDVEGGASLAVDFGPTGVLRLTIPDSSNVTDGVYATFVGTIEVTATRLPNTTSSTTLWRVSCSPASRIPQVIEFGGVPEGCEETVAPTAILPGRSVQARIQAARVDGFGNIIRRSVGASFQMNRSQAVAQVERAGDSFRASWSQPTVDAFGEMVEMGIHRVTTTGDGATAIQSNRVWSLGCDRLADPSLRPLAVTIGGEVPPNCFAFPDAPTFESGTYAVIVTFRDTEVASLVEW